MTPSRFSPGTFITARGREWMVLPDSTDDTLRLRPLSGAESDQTVLYLPLETEPVGEARFPRPTEEQVGGHETALLLHDALLLSTRRGAGPFRSVGNISVEPRAYQLVPLMMALKLDPIRLLIGDDVGVGKTIEAGLILREMIDRDEVSRSVVLCPPQLVEQWVSELETRFNIHATPVTAAGAKRLERNLPPGDSIFEAHKHTVVSLDYIKNANRRIHFLERCPEFVIVDEAHACIGTKGSRHQRFELLKGLAENNERHMVFLTATPHSGNDDAFYRLLSLLKPEFADLAEAEGDEQRRLRRRLGNHFVQRRRPDIEEWRDGNQFPQRESKELTYTLTGAWDKFFHDVLDYCAAIVTKDEGDEQQQRMNFFGTLALLRCAASSPAAAVMSLRTRAGETFSQQEREEHLQKLFDGTADELTDDDLEPEVPMQDSELQKLVEQATALAGKAGDPKLKTLTKHVEELLKDGFSPVIFCRYIATAHYVSEHLRRVFKKAEVDVVTGELAAEDREQRVHELGQTDAPHILVATDCLSEGINLQDFFNAVIHYDLSWNPTRHEQREGRVDRFGQSSSTVRATLMYGLNNPVDGAVLEVILRKAEKIRRELGVPVHVPDEGHSLSQALLKSVLLKRGRPSASSEAQQVELFEQEWQGIEEKVKQNRTIFAQRRLKPEDVLPEWQKSLAAMGSSEDVERFTTRAMMRYGAGLHTTSRGYKAPLNALPKDVRERLEHQGLENTVQIAFGYPAPHGCIPIQRIHPLVAVLAETLLERSLTDEDFNPHDPTMLGRVGCWISPAVEEKTTLFVLRLRHSLSEKRRRREHTVLVEESLLVAQRGVTPELQTENLHNLLTTPPSSDAPPIVRQRQIQQALTQTLPGLEDALEDFAQQRAAILLEDHLRVREAAYRSEAAETRERSASVQALPNPDIIGVYVLLPEVN